MRPAALMVPLALLLACSPSAPASWAKGGAVLDIPRARWVRGGLTIDVAPNGRIFVNGEHELNVDRGGRVFDLQSEPVALLEADGRVVGPDEAPLGVVGAMHASLPGEANAWLTVTMTGEVLRYGDEGERDGFGVWYGCNVTPRTHQTCTLITHLVGMRVRDFERQTSAPPVGLGFGPGTGIGVGIPVR